MLRLLVEHEQGSRDRGEAVRAEEVGSCCSEEAVQIQTWENYSGEGAWAEEVGWCCSWEAAGAEGGQRKAVMATQVLPQPVQLVRTTRKLCVTLQMNHKKILGTGNWWYWVSKGPLYSIGPISLYIVWGLYP